MILDQLENLQSLLEKAYNLENEKTELLVKLGHVDLILDKIANLLPTKIKHNLITIAYNLHLNLGERFIELTRNGINLLDDKNFVSSTTLIKSGIETCGFYYYLVKIINKFLITEDISKFYESLKVLNLNSKKLLTTTGKFINIMDCIRLLEKDLQKCYDYLCEFSHPNFAGVTYNYNPETKAKNNFDDRNSIVEILDKLIVNFAHKQQEFMILITASKNFYLKQLACRN